MVKEDDKRSTVQYSTVYMNNTTKQTSIPSDKYASPYSTCDTSIISQCQHQHLHSFVTGLLLKLLYLNETHLAHETHAAPSIDTIKYWDIWLNWFKINMVLLLKYDAGY